MMNYTKTQCDAIVADSFGELNYKQKLALMCAADEKNGEHIKYSDMLIKSLGGGVYNKLNKLFLSDYYRSQVIGRLTERGFACVTLYSDGYPRLLKQIPVPPLVLYCRGRTELLKGDCFSIVGSRRTPAATLAACRKIAGEIASKMTVVTGIADGADTAAIRGALASGNIICVLPGGYDYLYPTSSGPLIAEVEKRGLVISEWPPHTAVQRYMFTVRNRIIAGISRGVLVASAPKKSGALITANYAADYGREVFAFPHSLGISAGEGSNALIKNGAFLCQNVLDIFSSFGLEYKTEEKSLSAEEEKVISFLRENGQSHIQDIAKAVGIKVFQAVTTLSALEIKGLVVRCGGNTYEAC